jgi:hypothetical protein
VPLKKRKKSKKKAKTEKEAPKVVIKKPKVNISEIFGVTRKPPKPLKKKKKRKGVYFRKMTDILKITPKNIVTEKVKFFEKEGCYNPEFTYSVKKIKSK